MALRSLNKIDVDQDSRSTALIQPLAWEPANAADAALKKGKKKKKKKTLTIVVLVAVEVQVPSPTRRSG